MSIKRIDVRDLLEYEGKEGLIIQGCGGDPQEWVDGINDMLTKQEILLKGTKFEGLTELFNGPTAIAFANDPISACKACVEFAKTNEKLVVIGGAMGTGVLSIDEINRLAAIPSMDELRAKLIGLLQAPAAQLARVTKAYSEKEAA